MLTLCGDKASTRAVARQCPPTPSYRATDGPPSRPCRPIAPTWLFLRRADERSARLFCRHPLLQLWSFGEQHTSSGGDEQPPQARLSIPKRVGSRDDLIEGCWRQLLLCGHHGQKMCGGTLPKLAILIMSGCKSCTNIQSENSDIMAEF